MRQFFLTLALAAGGAALAQTTPAQPATPAQTTPAQPAAPATTPATSTPATQTPATDPSTPVGTVGSETLTLGDFQNYFLQAVGRVVNAQQLPLTDEVLPSFNQYRPQLLEQFARQHAVLQLAKTAGLSSDPAAVDKQFSDARAGFQDDAGFADALKSSGFSDPAAFRTSLEEGSLGSAYLNSVKARFKFGDAVVASFYQLNKAKLKQPAQACVRHILVGSQPEAQEVVKQLSGGAAFADLAKAKSKDPGSAAEGGDLGCLGQGETVAAFDKAAFSGPLNIPQVVQTEFGWHVLVVSRRNAAGVTPLSEVQDKIRDQLAGEAAQKYLDAQIGRLKVTTLPAVVTLPDAPVRATPAGGTPATPAPATPAPATPAAPPAK